MPPKHSRSAVTAGLELKEARKRREAAEALFKAMGLSSSISTSLRLIA
jgi:hypothetical protein